MYVVFLEMLVEVFWYWKYMFFNLGIYKNSDFNFWNFFDEWRIRVMCLFYKIEIFVKSLGWIFLCEFFGYFIVVWNFYIEIEVIELFLFGI